MPQLKVLLVDDSRVSRMVVAGIIRQLRPDAEIIEAADGRSAVEAWKAHNAEIGILDMNMPGLSGLEAAAQIRADQPNARLALLSANSQDSVRKRAAAQNVPFFRKPANTELLTEILAQLDPGG
jgi:two-component system, chemotaxis family, chemotaxis protein CheY